MKLVLDHKSETTPLATVCRAVGCSRSAVYTERARRVGKRPAKPRGRSRKGCHQPRALDTEERARIHSIASEERFQDQPAYEIHHTLLDEGVSLCSLSTFHRILHEYGENGDRRDRREPQRHAVPRVAAHAPNEVWTWDCSKLRTLVASQYLTLYTVVDLYSRYVVAWMISSKENASLATQLMDEAAER